MTFQGKTVVVTGGAQGIGKCIAECFGREGAIVHVIDIKPGPWFVGDLADKATLKRFAADVLAKSGHVDVLVNNALPLFKGIDECSHAEFAEAAELVLTQRTQRARRPPRGLTPAAATPKTRSRGRKALARFPASAPSSFRTLSASPIHRRSTSPGNLHHL